jgi:DNA-binding CsgD family transcriptional regulator/tetratricopeptide (TPR) repeat protein
VATRVTSSRLIGRAAELAELEAALAEADRGRPSMLFMAGESGVGKSRLLAELESRAVERGALVLTGDCVDLGESELPYVPLVAALRPLARSGDPALTGPVRAAVAPLLPGLAPVAAAEDDADFARRSSETPPDDQRATLPTQSRLFEGLLLLLDALGAERSVLLVIEDLHWADRSTRAALAFLARSLVGERTLVIGSYRPDELHRRHPLRPLLADLERAPHARRITLEPLTRAELADQLADILGAPPEGDLLERLWKRSGGNPLYCEELLAAGLDGRGAPPDTLRDALMLRVEGLPEPAQEILRLVAVGQRTDHPLLAVASGLDERTLRDALRETVDSHILVAGDDGRYRFRHALLREVVEDDLLPGERAALHLALARALETRVDEQAGAVLTAAVAHHFAAAGEQPAALEWSVRAAGAAERVYAHGEAQALLERALELWDRVPDAEARAGEDHVSLLWRAGQAASALGHPGRQLALYETALGEIDPAADPHRASKMLEGVARAQRSLNRPKSSIETLERALELVEGADGKEGEARARLLAGLARGRMLDGRFSDSAETARRALDATIKAGMRWAECHARNTLGFSLAMIGEIEEGAEQLREAIRIARERDDLPDLADAYVNYSDMLHILGRSDEARAIALEGREMVADRRPIAIMWLDCQLSEFAYDVGDWEASERSLPDAKRWTGVHTRVNINLRKAHLLVGRGDHEAAKALMAELAELSADSSEPQFVGPVATLTAELRRREGDLDAARAAIDRGLDQMEFCTDDAARVSAVAAAGVTVEADAAERARDLGDGEAETAAIRHVDDLLSRVAAAAVRTRPVECALLLGARAEAGRAGGRPDPAAFARAAQAWLDLTRPEPAAIMRWREAEAHIAGGDREAATAAACAAEELAVRLGAGWLRGEIEGLAARARLDIALAHNGAAPTPEPEEEDDGFGLTSRERQVLALVAEGATNREIGAQLFMAEKTASVHVSRILSKLNVRSRTEAAAVAHRNRLS